MATKIIWVAILGLTFLSTAGLTCNKIVCDSNSKYFFETSIKAYPDIDSIPLYDTIWLEAQIPVQLIDQATNQLIDFSNAANFGMGIGYFELIGGSISDPGVIPSANSFNNIVISGTLLSNDKTDQVREFKFTEKSGFYYFKIAIVPLKKGVFMIAESNAANVYRNNDNCTKASYSIKLKDTNQHLYLLEKNRPGYILSESERTHIYCFKVY